jgi:hypothetical protein
MPDQSFKRRVAKFVARNAVWTGTTALAHTAVDQFVDAEEGSVEETGIDLACLTIGFAAMIKLEPLTDRMVDRVADWRQDRQLKKVIKENPETE